MIGSTERAKGFGEFLNRAEERLYFNVSHYFWHLVAGIGGLSVFGACLALAWGAIPASKPAVKKDAYPAPPTISYEDVVIASGSEKESEPESVALPPPPQPAAETPASGPGDDEYSKEVGKLRELLAAGGAPWETQGRWRNIGGAPTWVIEKLGLKDILDQSFRALKPKSFPEKTRFVKALIGLFEKIAVDKRSLVLGPVLQLRLGDVGKTVERITSLAELAGSFPQNDVAYINGAALFLRGDPNTGAEVVRSAATALPKFAETGRADVLQSMLRSYSTRFRHVETFSEATTLFASFANRFEAGDQAKSLERFYDLYLAKNKERLRAIAEIDAAYQQRMLGSEVKFQAISATKKIVKAGALKIIGLGVILTAMVALLLALLSIQRNLRAIREFLAEKA